MKILKKNMKNEIAFLVSTDIKNVFRSLNNDKSLIKELSNSVKKIRIIDLSKYSKINNKNYIKKLNNTFGNIFKLEIIKNIKDLKKLAYLDKIVFINLIPIDLRHLKVWRVIKKYKLFNVFVQNDQFRRLREQETSNKKIKKNIFKNIFKFYYFFRILVILNYLPKINLVFVATKEIKESFENSILKKLDKFLKITLFSFFKKIKIVNIKFYEPKVKSLSKYICYIDTAPYDHPAVKHFSEEEINMNNRKIFYKNLVNLLKKIQKYLNKKIIICLHPKYNLKNKKSDFGNLKCEIFKTEKYIKESSIVLFTSTSMIVNAMILKKKILQINYSDLPNYFKSENSHWNSLFNFSDLLIDNVNKLDKENLNDAIKNANSKVKNYNKILKKIIHIDNLSGSRQIINFLEKEKI